MGSICTPFATDKQFNQPLTLNEEQKSFSTISCQSATSCKCIDRMLKILSKYRSIIIANESNHDQQITAELLNDYIHIISTHNNENDLEYISNAFILMDNSTICDISSCKCLKRYSRNRNNDNEIMSTDNLDFLFYQDTLDQIHCYMLHLYDMGIRVKQKELNNGCIDDAFDKVKNMLKKQLEMNGLYQNCNQRYNKYHILTADNDDKITFKEGLCIHMQMKQIPQSMIAQFKQKMEDEQYDSEALQNDIGLNMHENDVRNSNIGCSFVGKHYETIKRYLYTSQLHEHSFQTGYTFYYWKKYNEPFFESKQFFLNRYDHNGYTENELFIPLKYNNLKQEILSNATHHLPIDSFNKSMKKVTKFIDTRKAKSMKAESFRLHYNIPNGSKITVWHILSVLLYTDWTDLCAAFGKTFRKTAIYEPLECLKKRNREFATWAKYLREMVQLFGQKGYQGILGDEGDEQWNKDRNRIKGPFFCGISSVMVFQQINVRLCGPTSTSTQIEVAMRFTNDIGLLVELNNYGHFNSYQLRTFGCAWLSNYSGEAEWLFCGGHHSIRIESVRIMDTSKNYRRFFKPLFYFDCMINGNNFEDEPELNDDECIILENLIKHKLRINAFKNTYDEYINATFESLVSYKKQIVINLETINDKLPMLSHLFIAKENMLKPVLFNLFTNCDHVIMYATCSYGEQQYEFDFLLLLKLLTEMSINMKMTIIGKWEYYEQNQCSWIRDRFSSSVQSEFCEYGYNAVIYEKLHYDDTDNTRKEDHLEINPI